jgi:RNA polymerase sigma-70 factor (ECF subfamily)
MNMSETQKELIQDEDTRLIREVLAKDPAAFAELMRKHQKAVFNLCLRMLNHYEDAADCAQETFIKAYRSLEKFRFESSFGVWLYRIALNTCKNRLNSAQYRHRGQMIGYDPKSREKRAVGIDEMEIKDESRSPELVLAQKNLQEHILAAIAALPHKQRILIVLCDIEDRSYEEIANITGLKLGTVKSKLARARQRLRVRLEGVIRDEM